MTAAEPRFTRDLPEIRRRKLIEGRSPRPIICRPAGKPEREPHLAHVSDPEARQPGSEQVHIHFFD